MKFAFYDVFGLNTVLFYIINRDYGSLAGKMIQLADVAGDYVDAPFYLALFVVMAFVHRHFKKNDAASNVYRQNWKRFIASFVLAVVTSAVVIYSLKSLFFMPRPFLVLPPETVHMVGYIKQNVLAHTSFPSGHSGFAAVLVFSIWFYSNGYGRSALVALLLFVMWARIAAGVHFPIDVAVGACIGAVAACLSHHFATKFFREKVQF